MVQLKQSPESEALVETIRRYGAGRIRPASREKELTAVPSAIEEGLHRIGVASPVADDLGGQGLFQPQDLLLVAEELARADAGLALDIVLGAHAASMVATLGTDEQQAAVARLVVDDATARGTVLYFESFGRGPLELKTTVAETPAGWLVRGRKTSVARTRHAAFGVLIGLSGSELSALLLPGAPMGSTTKPSDPMARRALGLGAADLGVVDIDGQVAGAALMARATSLAVHRSVASLRLSVAAVSVGLAAEAIEYASAYATERKAFGNSIAAFQGVAFPLAEASIGVDSARLALWDQAARLDQVDSPTALASATADAVARAGRAAQEATVIAINTLGGHGYLTDHPVERFYRDAGMLAAIDFDPLADNWADGGRLTA